MKNTQKNTYKNEGLLYSIKVKGSLGLLAYGDIGLRAWRKVKQESIKKDSK